VEAVGEAPGHAASAREIAGQPPCGRTRVSRPARGIVPATRQRDDREQLAVCARPYRQYRRRALDQRLPGRIERQQYFINAALAGAIAKVKGNPLAAGDVLVSMTGAIRLDSGLDVLGAAGALREAVADGLQTFTPPVYGDTVNGNSVLRLGDSSPPYFAYFSGASNTPPVPA
jgi:hypothetical protein